jgi:hypothetical protein
MNPSIRITIPIHHQVAQLSLTVLFNIIQDWADTQTITTIQDVEVRYDAVDVIPFILQQAQNPTVKFLLEVSLDKYLTKVLEELNLEDQDQDQDLWYQENERFSIDYI